MLIDARENVSSIMIWLRKWNCLALTHFLVRILYTKHCMRIGQCSMGVSIEGFQVGWILPSRMDSDCVGL